MAFFTWIISLGASVFLPILLFIFGLILRMKPSRAFKSALTVGIGFIGLNLVIGLITNQMGPTIQDMVDTYHLSLNYLDIGWPPASAISYGTLLGTMAIPIGVITNIVLLTLGLTKTLDVDIFNYWHMAFVGSIVFIVTKDMWLGIAIMVVMTMFTYFLGDLSQPAIEKFYGFKQISFPHAKSAPGYLFALPFKWLFDHIPVLNRVKIDAKQIQKTLGIFGDTTVLGALIGFVIALLAKQSIADCLKLAVNMGAVMLLMPKMVSLLMEGLTPISEGTNTVLKKYFPNRELYIGMDSALAVGHETVLSSALILIPITLLLAVVLPGVRVLPFGDLANIPYLIALFAAIFEGDILRTVLTGMANMIIFLYVATWTAPIVTQLAVKIGFDMGKNSSIAVLSDGGLWTNFFYIFGTTHYSWLAVGIMFVIALGCLIWLNKIRDKKTL